MLQLEEKCKTLDVTVKRFFDKSDILRQKGLPNPLVIIDKLMIHEDYDKNMREVAKETSNSSSIKGVLTEKVLLHTLKNFFYLQHELNHLFVNKPTFAKYSKAYEIYCRMMKIKITDEEMWEKCHDL